MTVDLPITTRVGQETAALRDFDPAYDRRGSFTLLDLDLQFSD